MRSQQSLIRAKQTVRQSATVFLRALGLHLIVSVFRSLRHLAVGKGYDEPTKIAIRKSRPYALVRALIHIVPVGVAMWEITINWNTYYLGATIRNQAFYQFAAKIHEMTAQASLAAIVFSYIRYEMSSGQGLPFGAMFSGLQISQASYLWSMEFWGSIYSKHLPIGRRITLILVITSAIILAAAVGPSSAILLIPRLEYWPAGATDIWLNVTSQELWPDRTNGTLVPADCVVSDPLAIGNKCPSSGWQAIETYLSLSNQLLPLDMQSKYSYTPSPAFIQTTGANSLRQLRISNQRPINNGTGAGAVTAVATTQQVAVADALSTTGVIWQLALQNMTSKGHGSVLDQLDAVHSIVTGYYQPYTIGTCQSDTFYGHEDQDPVAFPLPPGTLIQMLNTSALNDSVLSSPGFVYPGITRSQLLDTPGFSNDYRLRWIELPQDPFNGTAIGAVVLLPRADENTTQEVLMCNLGAGWGKSNMNTSTYDGGSQAVFSEVELSPIPGSLNTDAKSRPASARFTPLTEELDTAEVLFYPPSLPQRQLIATEDWAAYLNPLVSNSTSTVFHHLMSSHLLETGIGISATIVLTSLLANGLATIGSTGQLQGTVKTVVERDGSEGLNSDYWFSGKGDIFIVDPLESKDWVKFRVYSTIEGFAYNTRGAIPKVAICVLLAYCIFALAHVLYAGISGISSTCWDSIGEVTALAVNSAPTALLRNTCAGITELSIFKTPVRVLAFRDNDNSDGEHLELVFGDLDEKNVQHQVIKENRVYGTMPALARKRRKTL